MRASSASSGCAPSRSAFVESIAVAQKSPIFCWSLPCLDFCFGRGLADRAQPCVQLLVDLVADAPGRFRLRDRMRLQPSAVRVLEEVDARIHRRVEVGGEEILWRRGGRGGGEREGRGEQRGAVQGGGTAHRALRSDERTAHCVGRGAVRQAPKVTAFTFTTAGHARCLARAGLVVHSESEGSMATALALRSRAPPPARPRREAGAPTRARRSRPRRGSARCPPASRGR